MKSNNRRRRPYRREVEGLGVWVTVLPLSTQLANNPPITELHSGEREGTGGREMFLTKKEALFRVLALPR